MRLSVASVEMTILWCHTLEVLASQPLCGLEGDDGDFGGAVEAEGQAYGSDAAVDIELHAVELVETFGVFSAQWGQDHRAKEGEPNLAAVGVSGEHEIDEGAAWVGGDVVGKVRLVGHEKHWSVGFGGDCEI